MFWVGAEVEKMIIEMFQMGETRSADKLSADVNITPVDI